MEEFEYDVVIYGTGLVNCLVASILTKNKFKVLHIDKHSEYGNNYRTLSFRQLLELKNSVPLSRSLTKRTSTLETGDRQNSLDSSSGPGTLSSLDSISSMNSSVNPETNEETQPETPTSRSESRHLGVLSSLMKQSNSFNIDLWPRILLNNTTFTDFLVYTNIHKQLQLCTNINTNVLFSYEAYLMTSDARKGANGSVSDASNVSNTASNKGKETSGSSTTKNFSETTGLLFELVHDKNSIFRSKYLDLKEKRLLTRFINKSLLDATGGEEDESWVEYLKKNNLNEKLINIVNCMRLSVVGGTSKNKCKVELSNYLKSFKVGSDKTATENRSCIIYCLYGTNNLIQHICRLSSLNNCHYMLSHEIKDMEVVERSVYSRVGSNVSTAGETGKKEATNEDGNEGTANGGSNNRKILLHLDDYDIYTNYVITEYAVSTTATINRVYGTEDYTTEEGSVEGTTEGTEEDSQEGTSEGISKGIAKGSVQGNAKGIEEGNAKGSVQGNAKGSVQGNAKGIEEGNAKGSVQGNAKGIEEGRVAGAEDKKLLVVCMISDRMVLDDINMCMVIPGTTKEKDSTSTSATEGTSGGQKSNSGSGSDGKVSSGTGEDWTVILQTCKDSQSSPEGMYVVYFMSLASASASSTGTEYSHGRQEEKESVGNDGALEEGEKMDDNVLRMVNMYKALVGDLSHMLFVSYGYYDTGYEIEVIASNSSATQSNKDGSKDSSRSTESNSSANGTVREEEAQRVNQVTVYKNKYKNDSMLVFMNELKISEKVAELVMKLNKEKRADKSVEDEGGSGDGSGSGKVGGKFSGKKEEEVDFEKYLKCIVPEDEEQVDLNCDFFMDFVNKLF
ncbi:uncharacterized protein TOT_040000816 [Theileria orientalis strain Shintoku]|uniref:GDP dissociation inhibitor n=1 Tax=Theileria orientalis strain Shintoku TaxID=869250 RepID=J7MF57_THEOR|nr:uncharacterized protein TOT_040000816 [Theileria orientalis strain Shintoku]BAM42449.1 uncharacterized protein TOT_040000816 [Theileria orientalis strain Shintoku]|eukprot:XP_009692750.1 uncharacterized protein TOT_040000816 [Theileria orientalis strain Shintoku]